MAKKGFSVADLIAMGLEDDGKGGWKKRKITSGAFKGQYVPIKTIDHVKINEQLSAVLRQEIFIPYEVRSSKNSKQIKFIWDDKKKKSRPIIVDSEAVEAYKTMSLMSYKAFRADFLKMAEGKPFPLIVGYRFARATKAENWDFNNITQVVQDMMKREAWVPDDSVRYLIPQWLPHFQDSQNPGVYISVL